jgi:hypothetical protein
VGVRRKFGDLEYCCRDLKEGMNSGVIAKIAMATGGVRY